MMEVFKIPTEGLAATDVLPLDQMVFTTIVSGVPIESTHVLLKTHVDPISETVETRGEHGEESNASIGEENLARI